VSIAQAVFLLEHGQTNRQTDATERYTHAGGFASVGNKDHHCAVAAAIHKPPSNWK